MVVFILIGDFVVDFIGGGVDVVVVVSVVVVVVEDEEETSWVNMLEEASWKAERTHESPN